MTEAVIRANRWTGFYMITASNLVYEYWKFFTSPQRLIINPLMPGGNKKVTHT